MKGVFLDRMSLDNEDLDFSALDAVIDEWQLFAETSPDDVLSRIQDADIVISNKVALRAETLAQASNLKLICVAATGTNNVNLDAALANNIQVCNVRAYGSPSVAQHVFMLLLNLSRSFNNYQSAVQNGRWQTSSQFCFMDYPIADLSGKVMGIVGYGELGQAVAKLAEAFGMTVKIAQRPGGDKKPGRLELDELLAEADVVSLHCPLTDETRNLIGEEQFSKMKPSAFLINAARGGIVDESALVKALCNQQIAGAGFDVLVEEPPQDDSPLLDNTIPNLIVTPHIAWASQLARQTLLNIIVENIRSFQNGELNNRVI